MRKRVPEEPVTVWHIVNKCTTWTDERDAMYLTEIRVRGMLFTDTKFLCDEMPSVSRNREVEPRTERNDSFCCHPKFSMGLNT